MEEYQIISKIEENRIEAVINEQVVGLIDFYQSRDSRTLIVTHTEVIGELEGQGIAGAMTKSLLEYACEHQFKVMPVCPYTRVYMDRHPEYDNLKANS